MLQNYKYVVSVIIPMHNSGKSIEISLDSLDCQTMPKDSFEIIIVDDASSDNSIEVVEEYRQKHSDLNIKLLPIEHKGVSGARNVGVKNAEGRYLLYLDSDDELSEEAIATITSFFDANYDEIDMVTYRLVTKKNGVSLAAHPRYRLMKKTGVYDLTNPKNYYIMQTTMNICVKNQREDNILFDETMAVHEDQAYCTEILLNKMKIGYCKDAFYYYHKHADNVTSTRFHAYYIFETSMEYWEKLFNQFEQEVPYYIQALYLNDISWKMRSNILLPHHYDEERFQEAKQRIIKLLNRVDDRIILSHPNVDNFHREYFISMKDENRIQVVYGPSQIGVLSNDKLVRVISEFEIVVFRTRLHNGKFSIRGFVKPPISNFIGKPKVYLILNGEDDDMLELDLTLSAHGRYKTKELTNKFWSFETTFPIACVKRFDFKVGICDEVYNCRYYFMENAFVNLKGRYQFHNQNIIKYKYSQKLKCFYIRETNSKRAFDLLKKRYFKSDKALWFMRNLALHQLKKNEEIWLYYDCKGVGKDNGYFQFEHDIAMNDKVERYYILNEDDFDVKKQTYPKELQSRIIKFGSRRHKILFLASTKIVTAYIEKSNYNPFTNKVYAKYKDFCNNPEIVYLQHGVLHATTPWKYSYDRLDVDREVISTYFERDNLMMKYGFPEKALIPAGMPRYDHMSDTVPSVNRILYAPSWRSYLVGHNGKNWVATESRFIASDFYKKSFAFISNPELHNFLEEHGLVLDVKLHPIIARYKHLYEVDSDRINLADTDVEESQYKVCITDISSFVFDFVYLKKPIIYFMPDYEMFKSGMNMYRELDIPLENGFGPLTTEAEQVVEELKKTFSNDFLPEDRYLSKMDTFFLYKDNNQTERIYDALMK